MVCKVRALTPSLEDTCFAQEYSSIHVESDDDKKISLSSENPALSATLLPRLNPASSLRLEASCASAGHLAFVFWMYLLYNQNFSTSPSISFCSSGFKSTIVAPVARWSSSDLHSSHDRHLAAVDLTPVPFSQFVRVLNPQQNKPSPHQLEVREHAALGLSSSGREGEVCLWDADDGVLIRRWVGHVGGVHTCK